MAREGITSSNGIIDLVRISIPHFIWDRLVLAMLGFFRESNGKCCHFFKLCESLRMQKRLKSIPLTVLLRKFEKSVEDKGVYGVISMICYVAVPKR